MDLDKAHLSFSGAGFLGTYHLGVVKAFEEYFPEVLERCVVGTSAGALTAAAICCSVPMSTMLSETLQMIETVRSQSLGLLSRSFSLSELLRKTIARIIPDDAHIRCSNRLHVSITQWRYSHNELVSEFDSKEDLIEALVCSSHIPIFCGFSPIKYRGKFYWDGGVSNNCPRLNHDTITVCPYSSPSVDICPPVDKEEAGSIVYAAGYHFYLSADNLLRLHRALYPSHVHAAKTLIQTGYNNAIAYMLKQGIIKESMLSISDKSEETVGDSSLENDEKSEDEKIQSMKSAPPRPSFTALHTVAKISAKISNTLKKNNETNSTPIALLRLQARLLFETSSRIFSLLGYDVGESDIADELYSTDSPVVSEDKRRSSLNDMMTIIDDFVQINSCVLPQAVNTN